MIHKNSQIDVNDLEYASKRFGFLMDAEPCPIDPLTGKINPQVSRFSVLGEPDKKVSVFHVKPVYYETPEGAWRPMYEVCSHYGNHLVVFEYDKLTKVHPRYIAWLKKRMKLINGQVLVTSPFSATPKPLSRLVQSVHLAVTKFPVGLTVTTVYPDPSPETTTVDGRTEDAGNSGLSWANLVAEAGSGAVDNTASGDLCWWLTETTSNQFDTLERAMFLFDTSSIADTDIISDATMSVKGDAKADPQSNTPSTNITSCAPASNTALAAGDFDSVGSTVYATAVTYAGYSTSAYNDYVFNTDGKNSISKTGVSKYSLRNSFDYNASAPTWGSLAWSGFGGIFADTSGTTSDPKLAVTHTAGATTVSPSVQTATFSVPAYTVKHGSTLTPSAQVGTFSVPAYAVKITCTVNPSAQTATFSIPAYSVILADINIAAGVQALTFSIPTYQVKTYVLLMPNGQTLTFSIPAYTVITEANIVLTPNTLTLTFVTPTLAKVGAVWVKRGRSTNATWVRSTRNSN